MWMKNQKESVLPDSFFAFLFQFVLISQDLHKSSHFSSSSHTIIKYQKQILYRLTTAFLIACCRISLLCTAILQSSSEIVNYYMPIAKTIYFDEFSDSDFLAENELFFQKSISGTYFVFQRS
uniref:Uncharacterized protein n=1 Tax=Cacopsylla melanoneura TaxID=428564 RepID=A0A8D8W561_9HEMI